MLHALPDRLDFLQIFLSLIPECHLAHFSFAEINNITFGYGENAN
jgi:hypothetical protein